MARACAEGLADAGCLTVLKHAPGHGRATLDSHENLPRITAPLAELEKTDFAPFKALADLPLVMTAHIVLPELDPDTPVTLSPKGMAHLRETLGLEGLIMTDDISMGALTGPVADRGRAALAAGCDLVLHCNGEMADMEALVGGIGALSAEAQKRADVAVSTRRPPIDIDIPAVEAEFKALIEGAKNDAGRRG